MDSATNEGVDTPYYHFVNDLPEGYIEVDLAGNFTFVNDAFCSMQGYSRDELLGMSYRQLRDEDTARKTFDVYHGIYRTGEPGIERAFETIRKDGSTYIAESYAMLLRDDNGQSSGFKATVRDVSGHINAEKTARQYALESTILFSVSQLLAQAPPDSSEIALIMARQFVDVIGLPEVSISLYDPRNKTLRYLIDYYDPKDVGPNDEDWTGKVIPISDYFSGVQVMNTLKPFIVHASNPDIDADTRAYLKKSEAKTMAIFPMVAKKRFIGFIELETWIEEYHYSDREMKLATALANQTAVALENAQLYETTQHEILERKQTEYALKESERKYRTLFEESTDAIFIVDRKEGRYLDANEAAVKLSGRRLSELKQLTTRDVAPKASQERLNRIAASNAAEDLGRVIYVHPDGTERIAKLSTIPLENDSVIGIASDITDELDMEDQLRQAQKMESIGTLAGGIAHDFNNILFPILAVSEMMMLDFPPDGPEFQRAQQIFKAGKRGSGLVKQILAFSRQSEHKFVPVKLQSILKDVIRLSRSTIPSSIGIKEDIQKNCPLINADPTQVHQIAMNLITNAYHAVEETGDEIRVQLLGTEINQANKPILSFEPGWYARLSISDNGPGIDPRLKKKIFDPYFTTKQQGKGTGLGLSVVYGIVKEHKGAIVVDSKVGKGSTFHVYLPLLVDMDDRPGKFKEDKVETGNENILLVDDEEMIVDIERMILERLGYRVSSRVSSLEALKAFKANPDKYDLVITDMTMPNMTGDRLTEELIAIRKDIPVILCTGFSENIDKEKTEATGIRGFLMKPIVMADMAHMVRKVLDEAKKSTRS